MQQSEAITRKSSSNLALAFTVPEGGRQRLAVDPFAVC